MREKSIRDSNVGTEDLDEAGWTAVDVGDELLLGSEEYGFMGLEVLESKSLGGILVSPDQERNMDDSNLKKEKKRKRKSPVEEGKHEGLQAPIAQEPASGKVANKTKKREVEAVDQPDHRAIVDPVDTSAWKPLDLHSAIEAALGNLQFSSPMHIQSECIPAAVRDKRDIIGAAQTGSGKTLAFGLPIIHTLLMQEGVGGQEKMRALILAPTRELALQVTEHLSSIARPCRIWVIPIVGGISAQKQERLLSRKPHIVVATPGRLWDFMKSGHAYLTDLSGLSFLVIDEADRMIQQGHYSELSSIVNTIKGEVERRDKYNFQTFIFSATLTLPASLRKRLRKGGGGASGSASLEKLIDTLPFSSKAKPKIVDLTSDRRIADKISEAVISCPEDERDEYLYCLLTKYPGRTIVFVNAISSVRRLAALLKLLGLPAAPLHAGMQQRQRLKYLDRFKEDDNAILVATDVAARGLDVKNVKCVVHYQIPASVDTYVHRCGRTARAEEEGIAIALVVPKESPRFLALLRALGNEKGLPDFSIDGTLIKAAKKRVRLAVRLDELVRKHSKTNADNAWKKRSADELGIELSEDDEEEVKGKRYINGKLQRNKSANARKVDEEASAARLKMELAELLALPLQASFSRKYIAGGTAKALTVGNDIAANVKGAVAMAERQVVRVALTKSSTLSRNNKSQTVAQRKAAALQSALDKKILHKQQKAHKKRLTVISPAYGRDLSGPDALQAFKLKMSSKQKS